MGGSVEPSALELALERSLEEGWKESAVRGHPFFQKWAHAFRLGADVSSANIAEHYASVDPIEGLRRISGIVRQLDWPTPGIIERAHRGVVELVELMTLFLCERRVKNDPLKYEAYSVEGLLRLPTSSQLAASLVAAVWLERRLKVVLDDKGRPRALNVLSDIYHPPFGFRTHKDAYSAELVAYLQCMVGGEAGSRKARDREVTDMLQWGLPAEDDIEKILNSHRREDGLDPMFGLAGGDVQAGDIEALAWMKERYEVLGFLFEKEIPAPEQAINDDREFSGLQGSLLKFMSPVLERIHGSRNVGGERSTREAGLDQRSTIFVSYSHVDKEEWLPRFQAKFKPLERLAQITLWDDSQIRVGDDWYEEIDKALKCCKVAILLISDGFLSSPFITEKEFPELLTRHQQGGMRLYPVLIKSCLWERDPELARLQIKMARGESPLEKLCSEDAALNEELTAIAREIVDIIQPR